MLDLVLRDGYIADGTGAEGAVGDVGIRDGRIVEVGRVTESAARTIDARGLPAGAPGVASPLVSRKEDSLKNLW
jgi:N-acyl-D-aspartate/D-glutamate deacylase